MTDPLHLPSLSIRSFRGVDDLRIPKLGRVTLLAGKNGVGKTTVLDAVRVYAARGRYSALDELLRSRQEVSIGTYEDGETETVVKLQAVFNGRTTPESGGISIGPANGADQLRIEPDSMTDEQVSRAARFRPDLQDSPRRAVKAKYRGNEQILWCFSSMVRHNSAAYRQLLNQDEPPPVVKCESVGPEIPNNAELSRLWDLVALTVHEDRTVEALRMLFGGDDLYRIGFVGDARGRTGRLPIVRLMSQGIVPLKSLGDGAVRLFGVALALANSRGGFLLIDEAENGMHHTLQYDLWKMVLHTAHANDVQVLATTHSWDCVSGFARAASDFEDADGILVRLDRDDRGLRAVEYSEEDLKVVAEQGIEVR